MTSWIGSAVAAVESVRIDAAGLTGSDHFRLPLRNPALRILVDGSTPEVMRETFGGNFTGRGFAPDAYRHLLLISMWSEMRAGSFASAASGRLS